MALNLNHLRIFRAVAEEGSITGAAQALRIGQPAVSRQLAEFEASVGARLVDRLPRGVRLTAAGELLAERARRLFAEEKAAERDLAELLGLARGQLSVGASTTIGASIVPRLFGEFARLHGNVALELRIGNTRAIQAEVLDGSLDVGLTEGFADAEALDASVFTHDDLVLVAGPDMAGRPLEGVREVQVADLAGLPFILREAGSGSRDVIEDALAARGVRLEPRMHLGSTEAIKGAVMLGLGVAMVSRLTITLECETGRLREVPVAGLSIRRALHCLTLKGKEPSPAARAFLGLLAGHFGAAGRR